LARFAHNRRLADALQMWAFCSLGSSLGARHLRRTPSQGAHAPTRAAIAREPMGRHSPRVPPSPRELLGSHGLAGDHRGRRL